MFSDNSITMPQSVYLDWLRMVESGTWNWLANSRCKHITTAMDTRSNRIYVYDRDKVNISAEQLLYQSNN
jgi:hypothetical protein